MAAAAQPVQAGQAFAFTKTCTVADSATCAGDGGPLLAGPFSGFQGHSGTGSALLGAAVPQAFANGQLVGPLAFATEHASATSPGASMLSYASISLLKEYTWTGPTGFAVPLVGNLSYDGAGGQIFADVWITDRSFLSGSDPFAAFTALDNFVSNPYTGTSNPCAAAGVLAFADFTVTASGPDSQMLSLANNCGGTPLSFSHGQDLVMLTHLAVAANNGASVDASHTFSVSLSPSLSTADRDLIIADLQPAPIPEPATWVMILMGFGCLGARLRTRRVRALRTLLPAL